MTNINAKSIYSRLKFEARELRRWSSRYTANPNDLRVFYGYDHVAGRGENAWGGLIKLQDLVTSFPNQPVTPNILYLVSSGLPLHATRMTSLALKRDCKVVLNQNGVAYPAWCGADSQNHNVHMSEILHKADWVFYQSEFCKLSADQFLGKRDADTEILYNCVDTNYFVPGSKPQKLNHKIRLLLAGSQGRVYRAQKAIQTLSVLLRSGFDCELVIAGRLSWRQNEQTAISEAYDMAKKENVVHAISFLGPYTQTEAVKIFQEADILLHPTYNDVCPRLVIEAMSCGLPIAYSASGGVPELVGGSAGIGVPAPLDWQQEHPPSPDALANAIKDIFADYTRYSINARQRAVEKFDVVPWVKRHREVFWNLFS